MQLRSILTAIALTSALSGNAFAQSETVKFGPKPKWVIGSEPMPVPDNPEGLVFVRSQDIFIHVDDRGQHLYSGLRIKILHPNALQLGNISLSWDPAAGETIVHSIKVFREGTVIDALPSTKFEMLRREDQLEAAMLTGELTAVARVPDLRVDDELELSYTTRHKDPTLGNRGAGYLFIGPQTAPGRYALNLSWAPDRNPITRLSSDIEPVVVRGERSISLRLDNPAKINLAKDAPPRFNWQRFMEYSEFPEWANVSELFAPLYAAAATLKPDSPLKAEAARIASAHPTTLDRARAALKLVQRDVRYVYVGLNGGNFRPATAEETWVRRYGDCKGKTALLLALLNELGVEAEAVLANNSGADDGLDQRLPSPNLFDHILVRATIDGQVFYMDGTLPFVAEPSITPYIPYRWVLPVRAGQAQLQRLEHQPAHTPDEINLFEIDAREGFDQPATITATYIVRGFDGLQQQAQFSSLTPTQIEENLRQNLVGDTWQEISSAKWKYDIKARASILTITGKGDIDWEDERRGSKALSLPGGGFNPPEKRIRATGQDQSIPFFAKREFVCHVTTVRLPTSTKPEQWSFNKGFDVELFGRNYYRAFDYKDHSIRMIRGSRVETEEIDAAKAATDNGRIASFDNSMARIYFDPDGLSAPKASKQIVPATYDFDWTAPKIPCLPADRLK